MPRVLNSWLILVSFVAMTSGCLDSGSSLTDALATDPVVGRAPASLASDTSDTGNSATQTSGADGTFESRLAAEFPDCGQSPDEATLAVRVLELVNQQRAAAGLSTVVWNDTLANEATQYACEMIHFDFFDHVNPTTKSTLGVRADAFGYDYSVIGENLAAGQHTPEQAMTDWMNSPSHRQNILDPRFTELGVGVRQGGDYGVYWVQEFGLPAK
ncbi:MAG: CAP domain-containing protein [Planctomycetes bacterium]|nr:CAP domain-containing protein [Planctomycetota bacterium]